MSSKEKAEKLINKFIQTNGNAFFSKECALIVVDEVLHYATRHGFIGLVEHWNKIKQEIEKS